MKLQQKDIYAKSDLASSTEDVPSASTNLKTIKKEGLLILKKKPIGVSLYRYNG